MMSANYEYVKLRKKFAENSSDLEVAFAGPMIASDHGVEQAL